MEENNNKTIGIIIIAIVGCIFIGSLVFISKGFSFFKSIVKDGMDLAKEEIKNQDNFKNDFGFFYDYDNYLDYNETIKIYSVYSNSIVFSKNDKLYVIYNPNMDGITINNSIFEFDVNGFTNNEIKVSNNLTILNLNLDTSFVSKVVSLDAKNEMFTSHIYILFKNGGLSRYSINSDSKLDYDVVLKDYKISNIFEICSNNCEKIIYKLTLTSGLTKEVNKLD